jgi:hypothetical protein
MADMPPNNPLPGAPSGAEPLKKSTGKVQPKKETVRINLPPKPTAAPTIKLPTLPPGGPTGAPAPAFATAAPAPTAAPSAAAAPTKAPAAAAPTKTGAAPVAAQRPVPVSRPAPAPATPAIKPLDTILIYAAGVAGLLAVGGVVWVFVTLKNTVENFSS